MAYTLLDRWGRCQPLQLIVPDVHGVPEVKAAFRPHWWYCDPCNTSDRRYEVTYNEGQPTPTYFTWYEIVLSEDTPESIEVKLAHYRRVLEARKAVDDAAREYRRLTGCGWSVAL